MLRYELDNHFDQKMNIQNFSMCFFLNHNNKLKSLFMYLIK